MHSPPKLFDIVLRRHDAPVGCARPAGNRHGTGANHERLPAMSGVRPLPGDAKSVTDSSHLSNNRRRFRQIPLGINLRHVRRGVTEHNLCGFQAEPLAQLRTDGMTQLIRVPAMFTSATSPISRLPAARRSEKPCRKRGTRPADNWRCRTGRADAAAGLLRRFVPGRLPHDIGVLRAACNSARRLRSLSAGEKQYAVFSRNRYGRTTSCALGPMNTTRLRP